MKNKDWLEKKEYWDNNKEEQDKETKCDNCKKLQDWLLPTNDGNDLICYICWIKLGE